MLKILLIEDNPGDARLIRELLAEVPGMSFGLEHADRLSTGLERLAKGDVDVVLLDLSLPDSQGLNTLGQVQARAAGIPIVVSTGFDDETMAINAVHHGAQDYMIKGKVNGNLLARSLQYAVERQRIEQALRQHALELQARNEELDTFAHTVAHDLKNPVSEIMGYAGFLDLDSSTMTTEQQMCIARITRVASKMNSIINELLLLSEVRKTNVEAKPLDMPRIVAEAQERLQLMIQVYQAEIVIADLSSTNEAFTWPVALGYGPWIEEVWVNYLSNAIKYGGRPPHIELGAASQADGTARFWVHDNGPGVALKNQAHLFAPFLRLDQARADGHGLGLSIVRRIAEKLGGQAGVESDSVPGHGSVFFFTLPAAS